MFSRMLQLVVLAAGGPELGCLLLVQVCQVLHVVGDSKDKLLSFLEHALLELDGVAHVVNEFIVSGF